jgi:hypothetical protein
MGILYEMLKDENCKQSCISHFVLGENVRTFIGLILGDSRK